MTDRPIIPTLDDAHNDVLADDISVVAYLVAFSLINPGFTSEHHEHKMVSFSSILAQYPESLEDVIEVYEKEMDTLITQNTTDDKYTLSSTLVENEKDPTDVTIQIRVFNSLGINIFEQSKILKVLNKDT
jgi:hypothetical protein